MYGKCPICGDYAKLVYNEEEDEYVCPQCDIELLEEE